MNRIRLLTTALVALAMLAVPGVASASRGDRDNDKLPDRWERAHHLSTRSPSASQDPDKDGLSNLGEFRSKTDPRDPDTDNDRVEDGDEDRDHDGVDNANEIEEHTSPTDADSDDDGRPDGREDADHDGLNNAGEDTTGNDPRDADTDDDGQKDGQETLGTIASFDGQTLTITPPSGQPVTGKVTPATEVKCKTEDEDEGKEGHHRGGHGSDDGAPASTTRESESGGRGEPEPGDDRGGTTETGDDKGGAQTGDDHGDADNDGRDDDDADETPGSETEHDGDADNVCTAADLTAGTIVHEAELKDTPDGAVFTEIEILK